MSIVTITDNVKALLPETYTMLHFAGLMYNCICYYAFGSFMCLVPWWKSDLPILFSIQEIFCNLNRTQG
jgi:hypothetical protein